MAEPGVLEAILTRTAHSLPVPASDAFARGVGDRLRAESEAAPRPSPWRRRALVAVVAAAILALIVALLPPTRHAVADFLGIGGVRIQSVSTTSLPGAPRRRRRRPTIRMSACTWAGW